MIEGIHDWGGAACDCCGAPYVNQGCTWGYDCVCRYSPVCPTAFREREIPEGVNDREQLKKLFDPKIRLHGERCVLHCHLEHHPMYDAPPAVNAVVRDGW